MINSIEALDVDTNNISTRVNSFKLLLKELTSLDEKKTALWLEIYRNAIVDRQNAFRCYDQLIKISEDKSSEYAVHARSIAAFIERMNKANDQLIKLAALIAAEQQKSDDNKDKSPEDIFKMISNKA